MDHGGKSAGLEEGRRPAGKGLLAYQNDAAALESCSPSSRRRSGPCARPSSSGRVWALEEDSIFDIQIKRLHEYKRQQMNALYIIWKYRQIKAGHRPTRPITLLFGAKAAPAYTIAKDIIHLILCLQDLIAHDPQVSPWLKVHMVENYNITWAEKLIPACDISEQISLASKEASGTGNMKFMLNGAVTLARWTAPTWKSTTWWGRRTCTSSASPARR